MTNVLLRLRMLLVLIQSNLYITATLGLWKLAA